MTVFDSAGSHKCIVICSLRGAWWTLWHIELQPKDRAGNFCYYLLKKLSAVRFLSVGITRLCSVCTNQLRAPCDCSLPSMYFQTQIQPFQFEVFQLFSFFFLPDSTALRNQGTSHRLAPSSHISFGRGRFSKLARLGCWINNYSWYVDLVPEQNSAKYHTKLFQKGSEHRKSVPESRGS